MIGPDPIIRIFLMSLRFGIRFSLVPLRHLNDNCHPERSRGTCFPWIGRKPIGSKIFPRRVLLSNQSNSLGTHPRLDLFLSGNRRADILERFNVNKAVNSVLDGETGCHAVSMFRNSSKQIVGHSGVQNPRAARKDVHMIELLHAYTVKAGPSAPLGMTSLANSSQVHRPW